VVHPPLVGNGVVDCRSYLAHEMGAIVSEYSA
jgi:hypothetical protein